MSVPLKNKIASFSPERQRRISERAAELIAEETTLRQLRRAHKLTQSKLAKELGITQDGVSRLEKRSDMLLSTLRSVIRAMGGELTVVAQFPNRKPVCLAGFGESPKSSSARSKRPPVDVHR